MTSNPPGTCCTVGVVHEGTPKGEVKNIGNISTYFSHTANSSTENAILILPDVLGHEFPNAQLIADQFAANGYFTVMPDLFSGDALTPNRPEGFDIMAWLSGASGGPKKTPDVVDGIITTVIKEMRTQYKCKKIGAAGYCFGGKYVARFLGSTGSANNALLDAGYTAHPSFLEESELKSIRGPFSIAAAETDSIFPEEKRHETEKVLKELAQEKDGGVPYQICLYSHVSHGFAVKADLSVRAARFAKESAFLQAVQWFDWHLKGGEK